MFRGHKFIGGLANVLGTHLDRYYVIETGALEQAYAKIETTYAASAGSGGEALVATDGIRILELALTAKHNREPSPEKRGTPDVQQSLPRRFSQGFNLSSIMWEPSGSLGTVSNVAKFLEAGMGSIHTLTLDTTTTGTPTTTTATVADATGLQVGDLVVFTVASGARREVTRLTDVTGSDLTFDALSAAPDQPGQMVSGSTFNLTNNITDSLSIYKYYKAGGHAQAVYGAVVDQLQITFDGTSEVLMAIQGPAGRYADSTTPSNPPTEDAPQAAPASHTTVGSPASGLIGNFYVDGTAFLVISAQVTINNNLELRNKELGTSFASGIAGRANLRQVNVQVTFFLEDTDLIDKAQQVTRGELRMLIGQTDGSMVACVCPAVEFEIPDIGNEIGTKEITIDGVAYATSGNDQVYLGEL